MNQDLSQLALLDEPTVDRLVPYSRVHRDRLSAAGKFPKRIKLGPNKTAYVKDEIEAWLRDKIATAQGHAG